MRFDTNTDRWLAKQMKKLSGKPKKEKKRKKRREKNRRAKRKLDPFFSTQEWKTIRYKVLVRDNATCQCCARSAKEGFVMNVDHIKPRRKYPHLALEITNLQTLCASCNQGKLEWDMTNWTDPLTAAWREKIAEPG
jgi:5-methylcytosine-specific restriction endonuclease McrA